MENLLPTTTDHQLISLAETLKINLDGIAALDEIDDQLVDEIRKKSWIILLRQGGGIGHWVATHNGEYFDSTGVGPPTILGDMPYNEIQYQSTYAEYCGLWAILWLYSKQKHMPELMEQYIDLDIDII